MAPVVTGVTIDLDDLSDTGVKNNDNITNDNTPTFTLSGLTVTDSVFLYVNGALNQKDITSATTHTFTTSVLTDFNHEITMKAKDYAGNLSAFSDPLSVRVDTLHLLLHQYLIYCLKMILEYQHLIISQAIGHLGLNLLNYHR